jgi:hypothetical protein
MGGGRLVGVVRFAQARAGWDAGGSDPGGPVCLHSGPAGFRAG